MYTIGTSFKRIGSVAFSTDGRLAALSGGGSWECEVWSLPPEAEPDWARGDMEPMAFGLAFDPRTGHVLLGDAKDGLFGISPEDYLGWEVPGGPLRAFAVSPTGDRVVFGCELWDGRIRKHDANDSLVSLTRGAKQADWTQSAIRESDGFVFSDLAFFADGKRFASVEWSVQRQRGERRQGDVPTLRVHDAKSLDEVDATPIKKPAKGLAVCGRWVVVRGEKSFRVWDGDDLAADLAEVKTGATPLGALVADPQGRFVLSAAGDSVSVWDAGSWATGKTYEWSSGKITCLAVSPDGALAAAGTATGKVVVWDIE